MAIRVIVVEDESGIRKLLRKIIERNDGFEVAGECDNLADAVSLFARLKPEVVFLDIEINGASGIDCAKIIADMEPKTKIVFATAHAEYMPEAFEVYAFDYLVKPFDIERVDRTLARILSLKEQDPQEHPDKIVRYEKGLDRLLVKGRESMSLWISRISSWCRGRTTAPSFIPDRIPLPPRQGLGISRQSWIRSCS